MDDAAISLGLPRLIDSLDQSVRDIASGNVEDAGLAQAEARRMLAEYERARSVAAVSRPPTVSKSARTR